MNKLIVAQITSIMLIGFFIVSCHASDKNKWTPPKFVKEWEIKEIKPGLPHHIISMTANRNGVFVLVKAVESKYIPPRKWDDLSAEEKKKETEMMKSMFGGTLSETERLADKASLFSRREEINHYFIQHFNLDGSFISQWPDDNKLGINDDIRKHTNEINVRLYDQVEKNFYYIDSRDYLIKPMSIISGDLDMIFIVDYEGNKIVKLDSRGNVSGVWEITKKVDKTGKYDYLERHRGLNLFHDNVYIVSDANFLRGPVISIFDFKGSLIKEKALSIPKIPSINPYEYPAQISRFVKDEGKVNDVAVDREGNIYLLAGMIKLFKYNKDFKEVKSFEPILKEGFDTEIKVFNPESGKEEKYASSWVKGFNSQKGSGFGLDLRYYELNKLYFSPADELFVTFIGQKPFGAINGIIYNRDGQMIGYWKENAKSYADWFKSLTDVEKIKSKETNLSLAFQGNSIFVGKTIQYMKGDTLKSDKGIITHKSIVQRFDKLREGLQ